jgi:septum site-determining protein MinD
MPDTDPPVLAVAGGKGGCGKTTTTLGVALAAAREGRSVLAVDADVDVPDLHRLAGVDPPAADGSDPQPRQVPGEAGASVLPAGPGTDHAAVTRRLPDGGTDDAVLLDCPAGAGPDVAHPLRAADGALVVSTPSPPALRDAAKTAAMARAVGTPVAAAAVTGTDDVPDGARRLLGTGSVTAVSPADRPLQSPGAHRSYAALARELPV